MVSAKKAYRMPRNATSTKTTMPTVQAGDRVVPMEANRVGWTGSSRPATPASQVRTAARAALATRTTRSFFTVSSVPAEPALIGRRRLPRVAGPVHETSPTWRTDPETPPDRAMPLP
jgi:hypothetical protein